MNFKIVARKVLVSAAAGLITILFLYTLRYRAVGFYRSFEKIKNKYFVWVQIKPYSRDCGGAMGYIFKLYSIGLW